MAIDPLAQAVLDGADLMDGGYDEEQVMDYVMARLDGREAPFPHHIGSSSDPTDTTTQRQ